MPDDDWDPRDHAGMRNRIETGVVEEIGRTFPASYGGVRLELENVRVAGPKRYSLAKQRDALLKDEYLTKPLKADVRLFDEETGDELDRRDNITLLRIPYYTDRGTFIHRGNSYSGVMQSRTMPGSFTRRQNNGVLETQFTPRIGTSKPFRVAFDPEKAQFRLRVKGSDLHLYSVLKDSGVSEDDMRKAWGDEVFEMNKQRYDSRAAPKAFAKFVPSWAQQDYLTPGDGVRDSLTKAMINRMVVDRTLRPYWKPLEHSKSAGDFYERFVRPLTKKSAAPKPFDVREQGDLDDEGDEYESVGPAGVLASTRKLLAVNRGRDQLDNRHTPAFAKLFTMDKLLRERIRFDEGRRRRVLMRRLAKRRDLSPLLPQVLDGYMEEFLTKNSLTTPGEETNPMYMVSQHRRVTQMGPGGIGSQDAVTSGMQAIQASEFGFYSPVEGPESAMAGIDVRLADGVVVGKDGRMRRQMRNSLTGDMEWVSPETLWGKRVKLPD